MTLREEIETRLETKFSAAELSVQVQGSSALLSVVSDEFRSLSRVQRQQLVYSLISDLIQSGTLHAVTIQTKTLDETKDPT